MQISGIYLSGVVSKASNLIHLLFFLGYTKEEINLPKTNVLDWFKIRTEELTEERFFKRLDEFEYHGPKGEVKSYQMTSFLLKTTKEMEETTYKQLEVDEYNLGYGRLWRWFKYVLDCRVKDIMLRRQKKDQLREIRQQAIEAHNDWAQRKKEAMDVAIEDKNAEIAER